MRDKSFQNRIVLYNPCGNTISCFVFFENSVAGADLVEAKGSMTPDPDQQPRIS